MIGTYLLIGIVTAALSVFSTAIMSYIAMATPIGPWVAPMLVLISSLLFKTIFCFVRNKTNAIALTTAGGSIGGILATACGFSFPTLYFLNPTLFNSWMATPWYFAGAMSALALAAGGLGFLIANTLEQKFIVEQKMSFPIGQLVYKMIAAQNQMKKAIELVVGFVSTLVFCAMQGGVRGIKGIIPRSVVLTNARQIGVIKLPSITLKLDVLPMLWAIGFIAGHVIAIPLLAGAVSKYLILDPVHAWFFSDIKSWDFLLAFVSGMVFVGAVISFIKTPAALLSSLKKLQQSTKEEGNGFWQEIRQALTLTEIMGIGAALIFFFSFFKFSIFEAVYLTLFTYVCTYQVVTIAGKIGLAQLGRFATFVMVPAMFLFGTDPIHITLIATFVEICAGVATDILFGRKMAHMANIPHQSIKNIQFFGLIIASLSIGVVFWLLVNHFGLGTDELFAQRAQARALLVNIRTFNVYALLLGAVYGYLLKFVKLNPMLVLGGLIMPINYSLGLILGGLSSYLVKDREEWDPFWSGVFAANSMWELLKTVL